MTNQVLIGQRLVAGFPGTAITPELVQVIRQGDGQFAHVDSFQCAGTLLGSNQSIPQSKRQSYHQNQRYFIANCI